MWKRLLSVKVDSLVFYHTIVFLFLFFVFPLRKRERGFHFLREAYFLSATSILCTSRGMNLITMRNLFIPLYFFPCAVSTPPATVFYLCNSVSTSLLTITFHPEFICSFLPVWLSPQTVFLFQQAPSNIYIYEYNVLQRYCVVLSNDFPQFLLEETFQGSYVLEQSRCLKEKQTIISHSLLPPAALRNTETNTTDQIIIFFTAYVY